MTATNYSPVLLPMEAGADLTGKRYYLVKVNSDREVVLAGDGEDAIGVLHSEGIEGAMVQVCIGGVSKVVAGGELATIGTELASDTNGKATAAASTDQILGVQLSAAGAANELVELLLRKNGIKA